MKYVDTQIVFQEVPDQVSLAINISNCPCHCVGCHSSYLAEDTGKKLTYYSLKKLIESNPGIMCVAFMGGDADPERINGFAQWIKDNYVNLKVAWYSGRSEISDKISLSNFDFIKIGPFMHEYGPLNVKTTNQRMYRVVNKQLEDITYRFWEKLI